MKGLIDNIIEAPLGETHLFWCGQAGFIIKSSSGELIGVDLYLSDCVERVEGHDGYHRLMPRIVEPMDLILNVLIATHYHRDHFDIDAVPDLLANGMTRLFCAYDCVEDVSRMEIDKSRVTFVKPGDCFREGDCIIHFIHSDHGSGAPMAVGVLISVDGKIILEVGDTSLHLDWQDEYLRCGPIDVLIAPINGAYGNLDEQENITLTKHLQPKLAIPCHFGMFASHGGNPGYWKQLINSQIPQQKYCLLTMGECLDI